MLLSSDIDESAVSALVGSLESQLSSDAHYPRNDLSTASINNHITNPTVADCSVRISDGQKHGALLGSLLEQGSSNTNKNLAGSQLMGLNSVSSQNLSNAVIVSLPGALPASGYLTQVSSAQQALLNSTAVGRHVNSGDIKLVYSNQSTASQFSNVTSTVVTSGVIATNQLNQNNFKVAALHNGNSGYNAGQIVTVTSGGPVLSGPQTSTATLSPMQNLANIASQQPRIQVVSGQQALSQHLNAINAKGAPPRNQVDPKSKPSSPQIPRSDSNIQNTPVDHRLSPSPALSNHYQVLGGPSSVISTKPNQVSQLSGQSVNVVTQVVTNPNMLPPGVQIVNVNPGRFGQKTLAPRGVVLGNQVRIAPQMIRQGSPISGPVSRLFL